MNEISIWPRLGAKDLMFLLEISERTARRRIAAVTTFRAKRYKGAGTYKNPGGSRPFLVDADDVVFHFGLTRAFLKTYIYSQLNSSLFELMDERDAKGVIAGKWMRRNVWFAGNQIQELCIRRMCFFSLKETQGELNSAMRRIGVTVFPVAFFAVISRNYLKELFSDNELIDGLCKVFYEADLTRELVGYLSKMTGRYNTVQEIVLIDELKVGSEDSRQETVLGLLKKLGKKTDPKRTLVFLPDTFIPEHSEHRVGDTGFQKLEGTKFYISGSIEKFKEVKFRVWYTGE